MFNLLQTQAANNESFMVQDGKIFLVMTIVSIILIVTTKASNLFLN